MGGYVNPDCGGWTELRVHGVSGTPPEEILQHPHVRRVAGDAEAGFYRRRWESPLTSADTADDRQEAYSVGWADGRQRATGALAAADAVPAGQHRLLGPAVRRRH